MAQDTILRFFEFLSKPACKIPDGCPLEPYLKRICHNLFVDELSPYKREQPLPADLGYAEDESVSGGEMPDETYERQRLREDYGDCMARQGLDKDQVFGQVLEGVSVRNIAAALRLARGNVDRQIQRARAQLLDCLSHVHGWASEDISGVLQCSPPAKR